MGKLEADCSGGLLFGACVSASAWPFLFVHPKKALSRSQTPPSFAISQLSLEECTHLERVRLQSRHMRAMSLGTCPRLGTIAIACEAMEQVGRWAGWVYT